MRIGDGSAKARRVSGDRILGTSGIFNFRDYGGYAVSGGGRLRRGLLFRSGHHAEATDEDLEAVAGLGLAHVVDLRGTSERERHPCRRPGGFGAEVIYHEGETAGLAPHLEALEGGLDAVGAHRAMEALYARLPTRTNLLAVMRRYFAAVASGQGASLVHCLAGKDRTGIAVDLMHHALGVHPDDAMSDFLLTNDPRDLERRLAAGAAAIRARYGPLDEATLRVVLGVDARYLEASRRVLVDEYGSVEAFLERVLGVDAAMREQLRLHLVEA